MAATLPDVLREPLFRNLLITVNNNLLYHRDWIKAGLVTVRDLCYAVVPGFLPAIAIHEILTQQDGNPTRTLQHTIHQLTEIQQAIPPYWTRLICTHATTTTYPATCFYYTNNNTKLTRCTTGQLQNQAFLPPLTTKQANSDTST